MITDTNLQARLSTTLAAAAAATVIPPAPPISQGLEPVEPILRARQSRPGRRRSITAAVVSLGVAASVAALAVGLAVSTPNADAAVRVTRHAGYVDVVVTDPTASAARLRAALTRVHLDVTVGLNPVSPSLVGSVLFSDGVDVTPLQLGSCVPAGGGSCVVGFRLSANGSVHGSVVLGRAAEPGEDYDSATDGLAPGEALHCSALTTMTVARATDFLRRRELRVDWMVDGTRLGAGQVPPPRYWVTGTTPINAREVMVEAGPKKFTPANFPHLTPAYRARINRGC